MAALDREKLLTGKDQATSPPTTSGAARPPFAVGPRMIVAILLGLCLGWAFWPALVAVASRWSTNPQYSHGYLVPLFSAFLLWHRRDMAPRAGARGSLWGLLVLVVGCGLSVAAAFLYLPALDSLAFLCAVAALPLLLGGWPALRWAWPAVGFLIFMLPLPFSLEAGLARPLQRIATVASTYVLQTLGLPAVARGNTIRIDHVDIGVAEACGGLGMLITFCAFSTAFCILVQRAWWERLIILLSAVPIALAANVARIATTGVLHRVANREIAEDFFHNKAGWLMMVFALVMLWTELWVLGRLFVTVEERGPSRFDTGLSPLPKLNRPDKRPSRKGGVGRVHV